MNNDLRHSSSHAYMHLIAEEVRDGLAQHYRMKMGDILGFRLKLTGLALPLPTPQFWFHETSNR